MECPTLVYLVTSNIGFPGVLTEHASKNITTRMLSQHELQTGNDILWVPLNHQTNRGVAPRKPTHHLLPAYRECGHTRAQRDDVGP